MWTSLDDAVNMCAALPHAGGMQQTGMAWQGRFRQGSQLGAVVRRSADASYLIQQFVKTMAGTRAISLPLGVGCGTACRSGSVGRADLGPHCVSQGGRQLDVRPASVVMEEGEGGAPTLALCGRHRGGTHGRRCSGGTPHFLFWRQPPCCVLPHAPRPPAVSVRPVLVPEPTAAPRRPGWMKAPSERVQAEHNPASVGRCTHTDTLPPRSTAVSHPAHLQWPERSRRCSFPNSPGGERRPLLARPAAGGDGGVGVSPRWPRERRPFNIAASFCCRHLRERARAAQAPWRLDSRPRRSHCHRRSRRSFGR